AAVAADAPFHHTPSLRGHIREVCVDLLVRGGITHPRVSPAAGSEVLPRLPGIVQARPEGWLSCRGEPVSRSRRQEGCHERRHERRDDFWSALLWCDPSAAYADSDADACDD